MKASVAKETPEHQTGGRTKRTPELRSQILASIAAGSPYRFACAAAGISEDAFARWRAADETLAEELKKAEGQFIESNLARIGEAALKNWTASAWLLERRYPADFARRFEVTGEGGAPLALTVYLPENGRGHAIDGAPPKALDASAPKALVGVVVDGGNGQKADSAP